MDPEAAGRRPRHITLHSGSDRVLFRLMLLVVVPGVAWMLAQPGLTAWWSDGLFALVAAVACWVIFRAGFRTGVVACSGHFTVTNFLSTHQVPYREIDEITLDWLSLRFDLKSGERIRAWGLPESFLSSRGSRGDDLVQRLGGIVEQRFKASADTDHRRSRFDDWWVFAVVLAVFVAAIAYGQAFA
jgi:hypothetical protein